MDSLDYWNTWIDYPTSNLNNNHITGGTYQFNASAGYLNYFWDFGDNTTQVGTATMTHTYNQPGTYVVNVTISNACHSITLQDTVVVTTVGISDAGSNPASAVYPNPANDVIQVAGEEGSTYQIADGLGRVAQTGVVRNGSITVSNLAEGVYFLRIGEQESRVYSVIIRR